MYREIERQIKALATAQVGVRCRDHEHAIGHRRQVGIAALDVPPGIPGESNGRNQQVRPRIQRLGRYLELIAQAVVVAVLVKPEKPRRMRAPGSVSSITEVTDGRHQTKGAGS